MPADELSQRGLDGCVGGEISMQETEGRRVAAGGRSAEEDDGRGGRRAGKTTAGDRAAPPAGTLAWQCVSDSSGASGRGV
jgi:hypothetical protein